MKIVETVASSVTSTKQFIGGEERDGSGNVTKQFFARGQRNASTDFFYAKDHLASVRTMTDENGDVQAAYSFDLFGRVRKGEGGQDSDFQFAGYYVHARSGLDLTKFRAYSPLLGRFINRDPIEEADGANMYAFVSNSPAVLVDRSGLEMRVYSSPAFGTDKLVHVFAYSTEADLGAARSGLFGFTLGRRGYPQGFNPATTKLLFNVVQTDKNGLYGGMTELQFIKYLKSKEAGLNSGFPVPMVNDCHNTLEGAFKKKGVPYPGSPLGRLNFISGDGGLNRQLKWRGVDYSLDNDGWGWHEMYHKVDFGDDGDSSDMNIPTPFPDLGVEWLMPYR